MKNIYRFIVANQQLRESESGHVDIVADSQSKATEFTDDFDIALTFDRIVGHYGTDKDDLLNNTLSKSYLTPKW